MAHTIFILGSDPQQCKEVRETLGARFTDPIVMVPGGEDIPRVQASDTVIITTEEKNTGVLYKRLLDKLEDQVHRAKFLGELTQLFSSTQTIEEILEKIASKSTEVLGDLAFIVLNGPASVRLAAASSPNRDRLIRILVAACNFKPETGVNALLDKLLTTGEPVRISNLREMEWTEEIVQFIEKHELVSLIATPIRTKDKVLGAFISVSSGPRTLGSEDITTAAELSDFTAIALENARLIEELKRSAITDPLTGTYNARFFNEVLARETARTARYNAPLSLLVIDVDGFKQVNDTFGHVVGSKVLVEISGVIERTVRGTDVVCRPGGDEFGVVLPGTTLDGAMRVAEKILRKVESSNILASLGYSGTTTVSIGASQYEQGTHFETLVAEADQALYAAKRSSKNCARAFSR